MTKDINEYSHILKISIKIPVKSNRIEDIITILNYMVNNQDNEKDMVKNHEIYSLKYEYIEND